MRPPSLDLRARAKLLEFVWNEIGVILDADGDPPPLWEASDVHALEDAKRGNYKPLLYLLRKRPEPLTPKAYEFIADLLDPNVKQRPGPKKGPPDRPYTPVQLAANVAVPRMIKVLLKHYPELAHADASKLAIELCSTKLKVDEITIKNMMQRPLKDRRRR